MKQRKRKKGEDKVEIKTLQNKTRKGTYLYIKIGNKKPAYYKYNEEYPISYYIEHYKNEKKGTNIKETLKTYQQEALNQPITTKKTEITQQAKKYLKKIKQQYGGKTLQELIKKGITSTAISNAHTATNGAIHIATRQLIQGIVLDKKIQDLVATEENMKKLKNRLEHRIIIQDEKGKELMTMETHGKTIRETINEIRQTTPEGTEIKETPGNNYTNKMKTLGYTNITHKENGTSKKVKIITILRKGK